MTALMFFFSQKIYDGFRLNLVLDVYPEIFRMNLIVVLITLNSTLHELQI